MDTIYHAESRTSFYNWGGCRRFRNLAEILNYDFEVDLYILKNEIFWTVMKLCCILLYFKLKIQYSQKDHKFEVRW